MRMQEKGKMEKKNLSKESVHSWEGTGSSKTVTSINKKKTLKQGQDNKKAV